MQSDQSPSPRQPSATPPRVVVLNQYYYPDVASSGQLMHELAVTLAKNGVPMEVVTTRPSYGPPETWKPAAATEVFEGVRIQRLWTTRFSKDTIPGRLTNIATYMGGMLGKMLFGSSASAVYLYTTNPPFLGFIGSFVRLFRKHRYVVLLHDAHPQIGVWMGKLKKGGLIERVWERFNRAEYRGASHTIVLCKRAKDLVCRDYGVRPERVHVIPNWADGEKIFPRAKASCAFAARHNLIEPFTVLYSGNLGLYYDFETLLQAAALLKGENFRLVLAGGGGKREWLIDQVKQRGLTNTTVHPYVPAEELNDSLNSCDVSMVTIAEGIEGISFPSKLYSSLAVGKPIVAVSEANSELRDIVDQNNAGRWCRTGDGPGLAAIFRELMANPERCAQMGANARKLFEARYTREVCCAKYAEVFALAAADADRAGGPIE